MQLPRGTFLLVALILSGLAVMYGRGFVLEKGEPPAFFVENREGLSVFLGGGFPGPGVYQFSDGTTPQDVIKMTGLVFATDSMEKSLLTRPLVHGEALDIVVGNLQVVEVKRFWMPSSQRMALGIPLHPDRMSGEDWESLSGIGPRLALAIVEDRQQNGDFVSLDRVQRVKGIGSKRLTAWKKFFQEDY